ncbi:hypothetical protein [Methylophaga sp.]|nr:hypothetical protein [Methylophaga sp.]MDO8826671.1 hypothetical protein [Methylophaga sp.]
MSDNQTLLNTPPRDHSFDSTLALHQEGYDFIRNRCQQMDTDVF